MRSPFRSGGVMENENEHLIPQIGGFLSHGGPQKSSKIRAFGD